MTVHVWVYVTLWVCTCEVACTSVWVKNVRVAVGNCFSLFLGIANDDEAGNRRIKQLSLVSLSNWLSNDIYQ